jgi:Bax protein
MNKGHVLVFIFGIIFLYMLIKPLMEQDNYLTITSKKQPEETTPSKIVIEQPLHDVMLPKFADIRDVKEKKKTFFNFLRPAIVKENSRISVLRAQIESINNKLMHEQVLSDEDKSLIAILAKQYKIKKAPTIQSKVTQLLSKVDIVPTALVLVQAANESAWGTSRFARIGLNFFGIWCFKEGCGMVPNGRDEGLKHEVAAFLSVEKAVKHYLHNINTNHAYHVFRTIRSQLHEQSQPLTAEILVTGLLPYSERGTDYVIEISEMLRHNQRYLIQTSD